MNVLDNDSIFTNIQPGLYADDNCEHGLHTFCSYGLMVFVLEPGSLAMDKEFGFGLHRFLLDPRLGEGGSQFVITNDSIIYGRYVSHLVMIGASPGNGTPPPTAVTPIEQFTGRLYLTFLAKYQPGNIINDDELRKLVLVFQ